MSNLGGAGGARTHDRRIMSVILCRSVPVRAAQCRIVRPPLMIRVRHRPYKFGWCRRVSDSPDVARSPFARHSLAIRSDPRAASAGLLADISDAERANLSIKPLLKSGAAEGISVPAGVPSLSARPVSVCVRDGPDGVNPSA